MVDTAPPEWLVQRIDRLHRDIRGRAREQLKAEGREALAIPRGKARAGDVAYKIDPPDRLITGAFDDAPEPVVIVAEHVGTTVRPKGRSAGDATYRVIIDPLDGTREIMYDKRSAWVLTGVARNRGPATNLADVFAGYVTEVPPTRQRIGTTASAVRGNGAYAQDWDLDSGEVVGSARRLQTSGEPSLAHGFAPVVRYFPGFHEPLGRLADGLFRRVLGAPSPSSALVFDDSYIATGGQLFLLANGSYRCVLDLRPEVAFAAASGGEPLALCAHPYDLAGIALICEEAGAVLMEPDGSPLRYRLDTSTNCSYIGCANPRIWAELKEPLEAELALLRGIGRQPEARATTIGVGTCTDSSADSCGPTAR